MTTFAKRSVLWTFFAVVFFAMLLSPSSSTQGQDQETQVIELTAKKYAYSPSSVHVKQGTKVQLKITATDHDHGFKLLAYPDGSAQSGDAGLVFTDHQDCWKIKKGESVTVEFEAKIPGTYTFKCCNFCGFGHGKMKGQLVVDPS